MPPINYILHIYFYVSKKKSYKFNKRKNETKHEMQDHKISNEIVEITKL